MEIESPTIHHAVLKYPILGGTPDLANLPRTPNYFEGKNIPRRGKSESNQDQIMKNENSHGKGISPMHQPKEIKKTCLDNLFSILTFDSTISGIRLSH